MKKIKLIVLIIGIIGLAYFSLSYWGIFGGDNLELEYDTEKVVRGNIQTAITVDGSMVFDTWKLNFFESGTISKINVALGDKIKKGQVLAQLDASKENSKVQQSSADLNANILNKDTLSSDGVDYEIKKKAYEYAKDRLDAEDDLYDEYVDSAGKNSTQSLAQRVKVKLAEAEVANIKKQIEQVEAQYQNALYQVDKSAAALQQSRDNYLDYQIIAPVEGAIVAQINGTAGDIYINNQNTTAVPLMTLINPDSFWFEADVEDVDALKISDDMKAYVSLDVYPDRKFDGKVIFVSPLAELDSNDLATYKVVIAIDSADIKLLSDMTGSADLVSSEARDVLMISNMAVKNKLGKQTVIIKKDGNFEEREVETGFTNGKSVEIKSGLSVGDEIVIIK
jgi:RND family efflux transporter MFP subunit